MERLTTDKPVSEMGMVELAYNSCFAKDGEAYYRDFSEEISARNLARKLYKIYTSETLSDDDDTFDEEMIEELQYDIEVYPEALIALFYRNLWAMADLRETLKQYEDLGTVEELQQKTINRWIPCNERLPQSAETGEIILHTNVEGEVDICCLDWFYDNIENMVAWQPLPEAYKPE